MAKQKCPNCKSTRLYNEISVVAKQGVNTGKTYGITETIDNIFEPIYCEKCGWCDDKRFSKV